ncbi:MAG: T9SS type A sorting domain-containing protein [Candidatus Zixiibacteriota bacterium]|nr:MAG: T9SS type A sorting domain-containing protein [candidate division Zixibacteria bacterium]
MRIVRVFYLIIIVSVFCSARVSAQYGSVFFDPDTTYITVSDSGRIDISVDSHLTSIHCYIVSIGFDTTLVELTDVIEGPLLPGTGQTFFFWSQAENGYDIGSCLLGYGLYANGPGVLATMKFRARENIGTSSLHFTSQEFTDTLLNPIYVISLYGAIVVSDSITGTDDADIGAGFPQRFILYQNFPNPFNSRTSIKYGLNKPCFVKIEIFDVLGRLHEVLVSGEKPAGYHEAIWDAEGSTSGVYYLKLRTEDYSESRKMLLLK